jgi:hypothetical protein
MIYYVIIDSILHDFSIHVWYDHINNIVMAYVLLWLMVIESLLLSLFPFIIIEYIVAITYITFYYIYTIIQL